jgi:hypothetical protein
MKWILGKIKKLLLIGEGRKFSEFWQFEPDHPTDRLKGRVFDISRGNIRLFNYNSDSGRWLYPLGFLGPLTSSHSFFLVNLDESEIEVAGTSALSDFFKIFFDTYNQTYGHQESSEPPFWESVTLDHYPNYNSMAEEKAFKVEEQWINSHSSYKSEDEKYHSDKQFTLVLMMDSEQLGKYFFPMFINGKTEFVEFFDLGDDIRSNYALAQISMCLEDVNIKTALSAKVYFHKGASKPYTINFTFPTDLFEYSMAVGKIQKLLINGKY